MSQSTKPHEVVTILSLADKGGNETVHRVKTDDLEILQFFIPSGKVIPTHKFQGQVVLHCLEGQVVVHLKYETCELMAGQLLFVEARKMFSMRAVVDSSLLATVIIAKQGPSVEVIGS